MIDVTIGHHSCTVIGMVGMNSFIRAIQQTENICQIINQMVRFPYSDLKVVEYVIEYEMKEPQFLMQ